MTQEQEKIEEKVFILTSRSNLPLELKKELVKEIESLLADVRKESYKYIAWCPQCNDAMDSIKMADGSFTYECFGCEAIYKFERINDE